MRFDNVLINLPPLFRTQVKSLMPTAINRARSADYSKTVFGRSPLDSIGRAHDAPLYPFPPSSPPESVPPLFRPSVRPCL